MLFGFHTYSGHAKDHPSVIWEYVPTLTHLNSHKHAINYYTKTLTATVHSHVRGL